MRKLPPPQHLRAVKALTEELLSIRDAEGTEAALRQQLASCTYWQKSLARWLKLSRSPDVHWHGRTCKEAEDTLKVLEEEEEDIRQALLDVLGTPRRMLLPEEEAFLDLREAHAYSELPAPRSPDLSEPGSPEKIQLMSDRLDAGTHLYHPADAELEPTERTAYTPILADGNYRHIGRERILLMLMRMPDPREDD